MKRYLIATHGNMASGLASTLQLLAGTRKDVTYLDAYVNQDSITKEVKQYFETYANDSILVFTDLLAGSVNREIMSYANDRVQVIAGFNLPLILECLLYEGEWSDAWFYETLEMARTQMVHVNQLMKGGKQS